MNIKCVLSGHSFGNGMGLMGGDGTYHSHYTGKETTFLEFCRNCKISCCNNCGKIFKTDYTQHDCWKKHCGGCSTVFPTIEIRERHCDHCHETFPTKDECDHHIAFNKCGKREADESSRRFWMKELVSGGGLGMYGKLA